MCAAEGLVGKAFLFLPITALFCNITKKLIFITCAGVCAVGIGRAKSSLSVRIGEEQEELIFDQMCFGFNSTAVFFSTALFT